MGSELCLKNYIYGSRWNSGVKSQKQALTLTLDQNGVRIVFNNFLYVWVKIKFNNQESIADLYPGLFLGLKLKNSNWCGTIKFKSEESIAGLNPGLFWCHQLKQFRLIRYDEVQ